MAGQGLATLEQRMKALFHILRDDEPSINKDLVIDPIRDRHICGECALTFSTAGDLRQHFLNRHFHDFSQSLSCPHDVCDFQSSTEKALQDYIITSQRIQCGHAGCQYTSFDVALLAQHKVQHRRDSQSQTRTCPHIGCGRVFADQAVLFAHYDGLHPLSILQPGKTNPFKCPFCSKRYGSERFMAAHQRKNHSSSEFASGMDKDSQEALIRQSQESVIRKASQASIDLGTQAGHNYEIESDLQMGPSDQAIKIDRDVVDIHGTGVVPDWNNNYYLNYQASTKALSIGHVPLNSPCTAKEGGEEDYPESFSLNEWEIRQNRNQQVQLDDDFSHDDLDQRIIRWILVLSGLNAWLSVSEVLDVWDTVLSANQRIIILQQLQNPEVGKDNIALLSALHGTVLCDVIHAWAQFKLLTLQIPADMKQDITSAKGTILALLKYCQKCEALINEARPIASAHCLQIPHLLRPAPSDRSIITAETPFIDLLSALERRVKCRTVHPSWWELTNEMILKEMRRYMKDLKIEAQAIYPLSLRPAAWYKAMRIL